MEWVSGNIFIRANKLGKTGDFVGGHKHNFDHTTILYRGSIRITAQLPDGTETTREAVAPAHFLIRKDVTHEITALTDDTEFWCVYSHRDSQSQEVIQQYDGWYDAYI